MKKSLIILLRSLILALALCGARPSDAASTLTISPAGEGVFALRGADMESVAALDITIAYDGTTLANPRVFSGALISGATLAVNANTPGTVRIGIVRLTPITDSGLIATLTFDRKGNSSGKIISLSAVLSNIDEKPLLALVQIMNPTVSSDSASAGAAASDENSKGARPTIIIAQSGGLVAAENQEQAAAPDAGLELAKDLVVAAETKRDHPESGEKTVDAKTPETKHVVSKSVLERFLEYQGERTIKTLTGLFEENDTMNGIRQEPAVALSDGNEIVKMVFSFPRAGQSSPDYALQGASLVSFKKDAHEAGTWVIEAKPDKGVYSAKIILSHDDVAREYPLTLAPQIDIDLDKSGKATEKDFNLFLKKRGTAKAPAFDLNGDGKRDAIDDYIFTANYLVAAKKAKVAIAEGRIIRLNR